MKFIIDAQLPCSICDYFTGYDCIHTKHLKNGNLTKDSFINDLSIKEERAVITKDSDFYYSYLAVHKPYKLVLVKLGNMRLAQIKNYFLKNSQKILTMLKDHSLIVLEENKIKVLD